MPRSAGRSRRLHRGIARPWLASAWLLAALLGFSRPAAASQPADPAPDRQALAARGIRVIDGRHLSLYTDLPSGPAVDRLVADFDHAYPQWKKWFQRDPSEKPWRLRGYLINEPERFRAAGLMPDSLPPFLHGYSLGDEIWWYEQPNDYYRRHLMLHEGTHAFMQSALGGCGPPWYMEGMAELLATHRLVDGAPQLASFPRSRDEVEGWGRIKLVREAVASGDALTLGDVLDFGPRAHLENEPYGWCWAAAAFLESHPRYRDRFARLPALVHHKDFNRRFRQLYADDWQELLDEWQVFAASLDYGHDLERSAIQFAPGQPLEDTARVQVAADHGWQSSRVQLQAGVTYDLRASGRYRVAGGPPPWISEPGGVSIRYHASRPLGMLLAAIRHGPDNHRRPGDAPANGLLDPIPVGLSATLTPEVAGTLYLRINDSPAELADNAGSLDVVIERQ